MTTAQVSTLSVNTSRGTIVFETSLEWAEAINVLRAQAALGKASNFALDLLKREDAGKFMSESQCTWVYKMAQDALNAAKPKPSTPKQTEVDASNILASLAEARANKLKKPVLRLMMGDKEVRIKYMSYGKNAGGCWVTLGAMQDLAGKISDSGVFTSQNNQLCEFLEQVNDNVEGWVRDFGRLTSTCSCCGIPLTNPLSVQLGIGPICREKFGLA